MIRLFIAAISLSYFVPSLVSAPIPVTPPKPLPKGATARFGHLLFRGPYAQGLTYSSDGKRLLARNSQKLDHDDTQTLTIWDADTGKLLPSTLVAPTQLARFSSVQSVLTNDRVIWLGQAVRPVFTSEVIVSDLRGKVLNRFEVEGQPIFRVEQFRAGFGATAVAPDGHYLATSFAGGQTVAAYDLNSGKRLLYEKLGPKASVTVSFAQDNKTLFLRQNGKAIRRFELPAGRELPALDGSDNENQQVAASLDGKWLVTGKFMR